MLLELSKYSCTLVSIHFTQVQCLIGTFCTQNVVTNTGGAVGQGPATEVTHLWLNQLQFFPVHVTNLNTMLQKIMQGEVVKFYKLLDV